MHRKSLTIEAMDEAGKGLARIATLSAVDNDDDTYQPGAFGWKDGGQWAQILPAHDWRAMSLGKARVYEEGDAAFAELMLNLDHQAGRDWHATLKFDLAQGEPIQEWSYGYEILQADYQIRGESRVRVIKQVEVFEVSPVLRGAGIGTGTVAMKNAAFKPARFEALVTDLGALADALKGDPSSLSATGLKQLVDIHAALGGTIDAVDQGAKGVGADTELAAYLKTISRRHLRQE